MCNKQHSRFKISCTPDEWNRNQAASVVCIVKLLFKTPNESNVPIFLL